MIERWLVSKTSDSFTFPVCKTEQESIELGFKKFHADFFIAKAELYTPKISLEDTKYLIGEINEKIWLNTGVDGLKIKKSMLVDLTETLNKSFHIWLSCNLTKQLSTLWKIDPPRLISDENAVAALIGGVNDSTSKST